MGIAVIVHTCIGCGLCVKACPVEAIRMVEGKARIDEEVCILCGACVEACPVDAIELEKPEGERSIDLDRYSGVWVFCEQHRGALHTVAAELLGEGRKLADKRGMPLAGVLLGEGVRDLAPRLIQFGADRVFVVDARELRNFHADSYARALEALVQEHRPEIILAGATGVGRSFIPRVAANLGTGLTADCTELDIDEEGNLVQTRPAFGGNIMATILCTRRRPQMATVRPRVMRRAEATPGRRGEIIDATIAGDRLKSHVQLLEEVEEHAAETRIENADIVVVGGAGLQKAENFSLVRELADAVGGAVGATRTVVDRGWISYAHQVGQTGKTVCPKLYIAMGVSGAIQHIVGMKTSEKVIAINRDPGAPIFRMADWGLVGDLFEIVPQLIAEFRRIRASG